MNRWLLHIIFLLSSLTLKAQAVQVGMELVGGSSYTSFKGDLSAMYGFSEIEITEADVDTALARFDIDAPRWLKELFPGVRIDVGGEVSRQQSRVVTGARFFARFKWFGGSFTISDPRLTPQLESRKLKNQVKAIRLSLSGQADALAVHLATVAAADATRTKPYFSKRYDLDAYVHLKKLFLGDDPLAAWGKGGNITFDVEVTSGVRFTADPSPVVDLGSILFVSETLDSLMEGGILAPVENTTDQIAEAIQNVVFGKFQDPRVVPSLGWFLRTEAPVNFGGAFSVVAGAEMSLNNTLAMSGTKPIFSIYGYAGLRFTILGNKRN